MQSVGNNDDFLTEMQVIISGARNQKNLYDKIVNAPFTNPRKTTVLGLGFLSFVLVNKKTGFIDRISISNTDTAQGAIDITVKPFHDLKIPIGYKGNSVAEAIRSGRYQQTSDWNYLLTPILKPEEARLNQAGAGIASSFVYPLLNTSNGGAIIFQYYIGLDKITTEHRDFMFRYAKIASNTLNKFWSARA